jgi:hypothetical protein
MVNVSKFEHRDLRRKVPIIEIGLLNAGVDDEGRRGLMNV